MSIDTNKATMRRFVQFINSADEALGRDLIASDATFHVPGTLEPLKGLPGYLQIITMMRNGFPDIQWELDEVVAEDERIAARFTMRGTHEGPFFGVPPSGRKIEVRASNFYRFASGRITEEYGQPDLLTLLQQIGGIPA